MEQYYLKPMSGEDKTKLYDGFIERKIHGSMHACRAAVWALMMHQFLLKITPDYVNQSLKTISEQLHIDQSKLILILLITMTSHDAAREGEGADQWEAQSAKIANQLLVDFGLSEEAALIFSKMIEYKDQAAVYREFLINHSIAEPHADAFDYIRKLINLGDNLDLLRCIRSFQVKYIFATLEAIGDFDRASHYDEVIELIKGIQRLIFDQQDVRFDSNIIDLDNKTISSLPEHFHVETKVAYEQGTNVFALVFHDIIKNPKFAQLLGDYTVPLAKKYDGKPAFDPFIHGTNTSIFPILQETNNQIMSPFEMIERFKFAPVTGEVTNGGYDVIRIQGHIGKTSFGSLSAQGINAYSIERIIDRYTNIASSTVQTSLQRLKKSIEFARDIQFVNINSLILFFTRARQQVKSLEDVLSEQERIDLRSYMKSALNYIAFIGLLGRYIQPDYDAIAKSGMDKDIARAFYTIFNKKYLSQKIEESKLDIQAILENPTPEALQEVLSILELPTECTIQLMGYQTKDIKLSRTQYFFVNKEFRATRTLSSSPAKYLPRIQSEYPDFKIEDIFLRFVGGKIIARNPSFFDALGNEVEDYIREMAERMEFLNQLIDTPQDQFKSIDYEQPFIKNSFPVILILEKHDSLRLVDFSNDEYRAFSTLQFGKDIKMIATDTHPHRLELLAYLEQHQFNHVQVVLFDDLKQSRSSHKPPKTPYHHRDGVPTLAWQAAKKVSADRFGLFQSSPGSERARAVESLMEDATAVTNAFKASS